jgi:CobQ-like glutamine amidotransferase family enzyme
MQGPDGRRHSGAEILDLTTAPGPTRAVGEIVTHSTDPKVGVLTGFENHRGHTALGPDIRPLGDVERGTGNGDGRDGVLTDTVVGTYLHGPVLARNPALADLILRRITGQSTLPPLTVPQEDAARAYHLTLAGYRQPPHRRRRAKASAWRAT